MSPRSMPRGRSKTWRSCLEHVHECFTPLVVCPTANHQRRAQQGHQSAAYAGPNIRGCRRHWINLLGLLIAFSTTGLRHLIGCRAVPSSVSGPSTLVDCVLWSTYLRSTASSDRYPISPFSVGYGNHVEIDPLRVPIRGDVGWSYHRYRPESSHGPADELASASSSIATSDLESLNVTQAIAAEEKFPTSGSTP